jgi:hypothetical protein
MKTEGYSSNGLKMLHEAIRNALATDDKLGNGSKTYGVREYADWRIQADAIEAELKKRRETFTAIPW